MSDSKLVDIQPGGESTQYESIRTVTVTPQKETGQLGADSTHTISDMRKFWESNKSTPKPDNEEDDEWARQQGFGGFTTNFLGEVDKDLKPETREGDAVAAKTRRQQGYGPGSGVGA